MAEHTDDDEEKQDPGASQVPEDIKHGASQAPERTTADATQVPEKKQKTTRRDHRAWWVPTKMIVLAGAEALEAGQHETLAWTARAVVWIGDLAVALSQKYRR